MIEEEHTITFDRETGQRADVVTVTIDPHLNGLVHIPVSAEFTPEEWNRLNEFVTASLRPRRFEHRIETSEHPLRISGRPLHPSELQ